MMTSVLVFLNLIFFANAHDFELYNFSKSTLFNVLDNSIVGTECSQDLKILFEAFFEFKLWALQMVDANPKIHPGILDGNFHFFGNYDQCLSVKEIIDDEKTVTGQYCTVSVVVNQSNPLEAISKILKKEVNRKEAQFFDDIVNIFIDLCVPKSCDISTLNKLLSHLIRILRISVKATAVEEMCQYKNKKINSNEVDIYVFVFFVVIFVTMLGSTLYDFFSHNLKRKRSILVCFSLYANMKNFFNIRSEDNTLMCLCGIKTIAITWIVFIHWILYKVLLQTTNVVQVVTEHTGSFGHSFYLASHYQVDTLLSISGVLLSYKYLKYSETKNVSIVSLYSSRIVRLIPGIILTTLIHITVIKYLTEGPLSSFTVQSTKDNCERSWLYPLIFLSNNFLPLYLQCIPQTWQVSVDTQLYALAPILLINLKSNLKRSLKGIVILFLLSTLYTCYKVAKYNLKFIAGFDLGVEEVLVVYASTLSRMPTWLIGIVSGYLIYQHSNGKNIKISKFFNRILWLISVITMLSLILYHKVLVEHGYGVYQSMFWNAFSRLLWSLSLCFIILSCSTGHGGIVNTFLSHPIFIVLNKLVYNMALIHTAVIFTILGNKRHADYVSFLEYICSFCGIFVLTLIVSTIMWLICEAPVGTFIKNSRTVELKKM